MIAPILFAAALTATPPPSLVGALLGLMGRAVAAVFPPASVATTCSGLPGALAKAKGGETFTLPAGACNLTSTIAATPPKTVTITSADPTHPAVLAYTAAGGAFMANSSNLTFSKVEMTTVGNPDTLYGWRMYADTNISFVGVNAHGDPTKAPGAQISGFYVKPGKNISFSGSSFHDMNAAITAGDSQALTDGISVTGNDFYRLSKGGLEVGGASDVTFSGNTCRDFIIYTLVHSDCFQAYTAGTTVQAHDLVLANNTLTRGVGDGFQGLFIGDEAGLGYRNVTMTGNTANGTMWDTYYIDSPVGVLTVTGNYGASWLGNSPEGGPGVVTDYRAWLTINKGPAPVSATISGNNVQAYTGTYFPANAAPKGNFLIGPIGPGVSN